MTQKSNDKLQQSNEKRTQQSDQRESNNLYQFIYKQAPYGIFILNDTNRIMDANDAAYRLLEYEKKNLLGIDFTTLIHPGNREDLPFLTRPEILNDQSKFPFQHLYKKADNSYLLVSVTPGAIPETSDRVMMFQDISKQQQTQAALQASELKYKTLFENADEAIFFMDAQGEKPGQIIETNLTAARMHGYTKKELIGKYITDLDGPNDTLKAAERIQKMRDGEWIRAEIMHKKENGNLFPVEISAGIIRLKGHDYILAFDRDISDRVKTKKTIEEQLHFSQTLIDTIPSPIFYKDDSGLYLGCNRAFEAYIGISRNKLVGKSVYDIAPKHLADIYRNADEALFRNKEDQSYEASVKYADGSIRDVVFNKAVFLKNDGTVAGIVGVMVDITEKKQAENEKKVLLKKLNQVQKLEAIGNLSAGIAHDFNNILSGILGSSQLAKLNSNNSQRINNELDKIIKSAHRAADLVQQILTFSKQSDYTKQPLKLYFLVNEVLKLIRASIPSTIEIKTKIDSKAMIMADSSRLHQVIMNLCTNAYHAMEQTGGVLTVGIREIQVPHGESLPGINILPGSYLVLEVSDTGCGIAPKDMDKIFDPYFTRKAQDAGTGLGLSVVHGIVKEHHGYIKVSSKLGQGSVFQIFIPVTKPQAEPEIQTERTMPPLFGTERIMIVDDEEFILNATTGILEDFGYTPVTFSNGADALEGFKKNPLGFDLIITDMTMPGMTGHEMAEKILEIRPKLPIILCSGYSPKNTMNQAENLGIKHFLQKPVNLEEMIMIVRKTLDQN